MSYPVLAPEAQPCVWMCAGLLSYRLCERGFDCENCPLDAALRGNVAVGTSSGIGLDRPTDPVSFPDDRLYAPGHVWVQARAGEHARLWRLGLDAFAATVMGCAMEILAVEEGTPLHRGAKVCELELGLGSITISSPLGGELVRTNPGLEARPLRAVTEPYRGGWLVEIQGLDPGAILSLLSASEAQARAERDLRMFRRTLALHLLADPPHPPSKRRRPPPLTDLRQLLGGPRYVDLVREFVH